MSKKQIFSLFIAANFLLVSCSSSSSSKKKTVAAQRAVETREYAVDTKSLMQSSIGTFQDLGFTIDTISEEFGLITASKVEKPKEKKNQMQTKHYKLLHLLLLFGGHLILMEMMIKDLLVEGGGTTTVVKGL